MDFRCPKCGFELKATHTDNKATLQCPACDALFPAGYNASTSASERDQVIDVHAKVLSPETDTPHTDDAVVQTSEIIHNNQQEIPRWEKTVHFNKNIVIERRDGCGCGGCGCLTLLLVLLFLLFGI